MIDYSLLEMRYGAAVAQFLVTEIEKAAKIAINQNLPMQARLDAAVTAQVQQ